MTQQDRQTHAQMLKDELESGCPDVMVVVWLMNQLANDRQMEIVIRRRREKAQLTA